MRVVVAAFVAAACVISSASAAPARYAPSPFLPLDGAYRLEDGSAVSLAVADGGLLYTDLRSGELRQLARAGQARFSFGPAYLVERPVRGTITVSAGRMTITASRRTRTARRIAVRRTRVVFQGAAARIVGKVTSPSTTGRHPAIALVHGSEAADRDGQDLFVNFFTSLGYVVLSYDKRGVGASGGAYVERASAGNVASLAGDAVGALKVLASRPDVDARRLGLEGGSQAGWIIPRAAALSPLVRFAVVVSGPAMSVGEQDAYANLTGQGGVEPPPGKDAIRASLSGVQPSGFDPRPDLARLSIPTLWLFGGEDKTVYAQQSVAILHRAAPGASTRVFPGAGHFILDTPKGLTSEIPRAHRFAPGLFRTIARWLSRAGITS